MMNTKALLEQVVSLPGVSGQETVCAREVQHLFAPYCDESWVDATQSAVGLIRAKRPPSLPASSLPPDRTDASRSFHRPPPLFPVRKLMFAAHLDQIGLIVSKIEANGFLRCVGLGYDPKVLKGQRVWVYGRERVPGVIGFLPGGEAGFESLWIDTGLTDAECRAKIRVGDEAQVALAPVALKNGLIAAPFLDDRSCLTAMLLAMETLSQTGTDCDLYFTATAGEETTGKGACATAFSIQPDLAVVMDVTFGAQNGTREPAAFPVGKVLTLATGPLYDKGYRQRLEAIARRHRISVVPEPDCRGGGTDAASIRIQGQGIPVALISLPVKSMHTPVEVVALHGINEMARWVAAIAAEINRTELSNG